MTAQSLMKTVYLALIGLCFATGLPGCGKPEGDPRLQGTWRSNKEATVAAWRRAGVLPTNVMDRFEKEVLGKMTVTCSGARMTSTTGPDWTETSTYKVIEKGEDFIVIEQYSEVYKRHMKYTIRFVKDAYWISNDEIIRGYFERFDLVKR